MVKFYAILFTDKLGKQKEQIVVGTYDQANDFAIKEASAIGWTYDIQAVGTDLFNGIKNLTNL